MMTSEQILGAIYQEMIQYRRRVGEVPEYVVMNYRTRDKLRADQHWIVENGYNQRETVFGLKVLIDEDLPDDWTKVVGEAKRP